MGALAKIKHSQKEKEKYYASKLKWRQKKFHDALELLKTADPDRLDPSLQTSYFNLLANCYERVGDYELAFSGFNEMNRRTTLLPSYNEKLSKNYVETYASQLKMLKKTACPQDKQRDLLVKITPIFLVGFPRSGTTLLDTILRSHSQLTVLEEAPYLNEAKSYYYSQTDKHILCDDPEDQVLEKTAQVYASELQKAVKDESKYLIDKYPLNILDIPFIKMVFPRSKIICAIRDPFDCVFSCYSQNFSLNSAMANLTDLKKAAQLYHICFETLLECQRLFDIEVKMVHYEEVVSNFEVELKALLKFLNLKWEANLYEFNKTAKNRQRINTPSYSQVTQPLYSTSIEKWRKYEHELSYIKDILNPWAERFGYSGI